jgi:hypothetical protein
MERGGVGEHVALGERSGLGVAVPQSRDAVVEQAPARPEQAGESTGVGADVGRAHVLDHADARDRVEALAGELSVVHDAYVDVLGETGLLDAPARHGRLRARQRDARDTDSMPARGVDGEAAPATADVEYSLARFEALCTRARALFPGPLRAFARRARRSRSCRSSSGRERARRTRRAGHSGGVPRARRARGCVDGRAEGAPSAGATAAARPRRRAPPTAPAGRGRPAAVAAAPRCRASGSRRRCRLPRAGRTRRRGRCQAGPGRGVHA